MIKTAYLKNCFSDMGSKKEIWESSDVFKRKSLASAKRRKAMGRILMRLLYVVAAGVAAAVAYVYFFE